jgi:predicted NBD/HSP70 family sugar kinase
MSELSPARPRGQTPSRARKARTRERDSLALVLGLVRARQIASRQEIEQLSGLGRAVVADRLTILMASGLVLEGDLGTSTGGRAPRQVTFNATAGHALVASLGTTTLGVGLADLSGRVLIEHHERADVTQGAEPTLDRIEELFEWMQEEWRTTGDTWGVGLALPGVVEYPSGRFSSEPVFHFMPGWNGYPLAERLTKKFGAPVSMDSEAHLMALGELRAGRGVGHEHVVFVKVGTGISAGLCLDGRIHRGAQGYAGDIGHVAVSMDDGAVCRCGNTGCLEAEAGGAAIAREANKAAEEGRSPYLAEVLASGRPVTSVDVGMAAQRGDPYSVELLSRSGRLIGETLATVVTAHNPSLVIVGGGVAQVGEILLAAIREAVYRRSRSLATRDLRIVRSGMGKSAALVGAAVATVDEMFSPEILRSWVDLGSPVLLERTGRGDGGAERRQPPAVPRPEPWPRSARAVSDHGG